MENMRSMLHGVVVFLLFFTVQSSEDAPRNITIQSTGDIGNLQEGPGYIEISCNADCNPKCDRYWIYNNGAVRSTSKDLRITKDRRNSGRYQCAASNSVSNRYLNSINSVDIDIKYGPEVVTMQYSSRYNQLIEGQDYITLTCKADCNPECSYLFYQNGKMMNYAYTNELVHRNTSGRYTCSAKNSIVDTYRDSSNFQDINIRYGPEVVTMQYSSRYNQLIEGQDYITLTCKADCNPECSYLFYQNGKMMNYAYTNELVHRNMSGRYTCSAKNSIVDTYRDSSNFQDINIRYPPGIVTITPGNDTFYTKRYSKPSQDITCKADCEPECTYRWYREREYFTTGKSLFATKSYNFTYSYSFQCYATNNIGSYSYSRRINVEVKVVDGPDNVTIIPSSSEIENSHFQLLCSASCHNGCQSYSWYYNGRRRDQGTQILKFQSLSKEDSGNYWCRVTDDFGTTDSKYYTVDVQYGPKVVTMQYSSRYYQLIERQDYITLTCSADCNPACSYQFYQNEDFLNKRYTNEPVHRNMSGRYTCSANNSVVNTHMQSSNFVDINIKYKPTITSFVNQKIITAPSLLDFAFSVDSFPSSNVTIFHETKRLTFIPNVTGQLSFNVSVKSCLDQGEYRIEAVNDAGSDRFIFIADVECSPIVVRYSNVSHKKFRVGDLLHLTVAFMANPTAEVLWSFVPWNKNTSLEVQTHQIQNHKESTKIEFILSDTNKFGKYILELKNELGKTSKEFDIQGPTMEATKTDILTTISSQESDSNGDISMSPTSWKGKASALRETEMNTFLLQQDKLQEEVQKLRLEGDVLRLKRNYYVIKLQLLMKEHPGVINEVFGDN